ncbi:MAG: hypothetical protein JWQ69_2414 [Pseudomonas sp.]|nr:hypothetical protein [Pseudomonas sp.]
MWKSRTAALFDCLRRSGSTLIQRLIPGSLLLWNRTPDERPALIRDEPALIPAHRRPIPGYEPRSAERTDLGERTIYPDLFGEL